MEKAWVVIVVVVVVVMLDTSIKFVMLYQRLWNEKEKLELFMICWFLDESCGLSRKMISICWKLLVFRPWAVNDL